MCYSSYLVLWHFCVFGHKERGLSENNLKGQDGIYCSDLESTGLLHELVEQGDSAKLHCLGAMSVDEEGKMYVLHTDTEKQRQSIQRFLDRDIVLVMHNGISYDKDALEHFGYDVSKVTVVDTLGLSWYLDLNRPKHGLSSYGDEANVPKPVIDDWENLTQKDYDNRVKEDVKIQAYTYRKLKGRFEELYGKMSDIEFCNHPVVRYINFKMEMLREKQNSRIKINDPVARNLLESLDKQLTTKREELKSVMPSVPKYRVHKKPKKLYKSDGTLSALGEKWKSLTEEHGYDIEYNGEIKVVAKYEEANPNSSDQIKNWLYSLGWKPATFKYVVDKKTGDKRAIAQINLPDSGGELCPSIEKLADKVPEVEQLTGMGVLKHRYGLVKGFLESYVVGTEVEARASGFTNTLRLKHAKPCANIPANRSVLGTEIRSCMVAREGKVFCGSDLSSLESTIKLNLQLEVDREGALAELSDDFDPHLDIAMTAGLVNDYEVYFYKVAREGFDVKNYPYSDQLADLLLLSEDEKEVKLEEIYQIRSVGKAAYYSCQYGVGKETLAASAGIDVKLAGKLVKAFREINWAIDAIASSHESKTTSFGTFQKNKINGFWYHLKYAKDRFSTGVQGAGSYILDMWMLYLLRERDRQENLTGKRLFSLIGDWHDECLLELNSGDEELVEKALLEALEKVNKALGVEIPFKCSMDFGVNYAEVH